MSLVISFQGCRWIQNRNSRNLHSKWRLLGLLGYRHALWSLPCGLMSGVTLYCFTMFLNLSSLHSTGNWWCPFHATATITLFLFHSSLWCSFLSFCPCGRYVKCFFCSCFFFFKGEQSGGARKNSELEPEIIKNIRVNTSRFSSTDWRST